MIHLVHRQALLDVRRKVAHGTLEWTVSAMVFHVTIKIPLVLEKKFEI